MRAFIKRHIRKHRPGQSLMIVVKVPFFLIPKYSDMTISDIYVRLYSRPYYEKNEHHKFRFMNNSLCIDRRAIIPIVIHMLDGIFYMQALRQIENESLFRLEMNEDDITLYTIEDDYPLWVLE